MSAGFSDWTKAPTDPTAWIFGVTVVLIGLLFMVAMSYADHDGLRHRADHDGLRHRRIRRTCLVGMSLICALAAVAILILGPNDTGERESFASAAQTRFHITHLHCHPTDCPYDSLPDDGTQVTWLQDGRSISGRIYIDGNTVTLAPDA